METYTSGRPSSPDAHAGIRVPIALHEPTRELLKGSARIRLQEQPFQILQLLLARPGGVVTRDELRDRLWPHGTFVDFEHSLNAAVKRLRAVLGDDARDPTFIETLPRRGYRWLSGNHASRLAVLPFSVHSGDGAFGRGLTEELLVQLSHSSGGRIQLVARPSSHTLDYVVEGGIRQQGGRVRVAAWLVDARQEIQMWGDIYEWEAADTLPAQIDMAASIARSIIEMVLPAA
jgi:TolB-like protein